jgi:hypothetical protein
LKKETRWRRLDGEEKRNEEIKKDNKKKDRDRKENG